MSTIATQMEYSQRYAAHFDERERGWAVGAGEWLLPIRKSALARFVELGLPTTQMEDWRYTDLQALREQAFLPADAAFATELSLDDLKPYIFDDDAIRLVFVNGRFSETLSSNAIEQRGVTIVELEHAFEKHGTLVRRHWARLADYRVDALVALNTAFVQDGVFVHVEPGKIVEQPIHVLHVVTEDAGPIMTSPRNLVIAETDSEVTLVETFVGLGGSTYFSNSVTEIVAAENARVRHYRLQRESAAATHIHGLYLHQDRSSHVSSHAISTGAVLGRSTVQARLAGEGAEASLAGLALLNGYQHNDDHLRVEHLAPHCNSREFYKNVLSGKSHAVFTGRIYVEQDAQKTDGKQTNMNLLLSDEARVDTKPQLEIFADDVKCTHGATIGQLDREALFYLRSRGIPEPLARDLVVWAFAGESIETISLESLRQHVERNLAKRLAHGKELAQRR